MAQDWYTVSLRKHALRKNLRALRNNLSKDFRTKASRIITANLIEHLNKKVIALYYPIHGEVDITSSLEHLENKIFTLPCIENKQILFRELHVDQALSKNHLGVLEPDSKHSVIVKPEIIVVPMLGFDRRLNRIGYGLGYYDQALQIHTEAFFIGVAFSAQEVSAIPTEAHDQRLNMIITEREVITICK